MIMWMTECQWMNVDEWYMIELLPTNDLQKMEMIVKEWYMNDSMKVVGRFMNDSIKVDDWYMNDWTNVAYDYWHLCKCCVTYLPT